MADYSTYAVRVKGTQTGCYMLLASFPSDDGKEITEECGTPDEYELVFEGGCKNGLDWSCTEDWDGETPLEIIREETDRCSLTACEDGTVEQDGEEIECYPDVCVEGKTAMFDVEIWVTEHFDGDPDMCPATLRRHYIRGKLVEDDTYGIVHRR